MMRIYTRPYNYKYTVCCAHRLTFSPIVSRLAKTETGVENVFAKIANSTRVTKWYNRKKNKKVDPAGNNNYYIGKKSLTT